ncbi:hypothetical protein B0H13DRAFT_1875561 [Mycena leptocephala]|nr:hypothetical protein B0H13DRAFT_1875561 [Mycena leptocephala]
MFLIRTLTVLQDPDEYASLHWMKVTGYNVYCLKRHPREMLAWSARKNVGGLPMEVLIIVFAMFGNARDESATSIFDRKAERRRLVQLSLTIASVCRATRSLWSDIYVQLPELGRPFHTTEFSIQNQLHLSKSRLLRIVFNTPFTAAPNSQRNKIWEMLKAIAVRSRWYALHFVGPRHYEGGHSCLHAVFTNSDILLTAPSLRIFGLTIENPRRRCGVFHWPIPIDALRIQRSTYWVPSERFLYLTPGNFLQHPPPSSTELSRNHERGYLLLGISSAFLHTSEEIGVLGGSKRSVMSLQSLILHNIGDLPPVVAPEIAKLIVKDRDTDFMKDILTEILGSAMAAPVIQEVDLLDSPISNALELASIMDRCQNVRGGGRGQIRTDAYVTSRALCRYLEAPANRVLEVQFSCHPPSNNRKAPARVRFGRLISIGTSRGLTITFDVEFYSLKVVTKVQYFNSLKNSENTRRLVAESNLGSALIVVNHSRVNQGGRTALQLVLVLQDRSVAFRIHNNGLSIHNHIHYDITMTIFSGNSMARKNSCI